MKKVLFVLTSHAELGHSGQKTGFWIEEFASPYYHMVDHDVEVSLSSPKGGQPPIDPKSNEGDSLNPATIRFNEDATLKETLSQTSKLENINPSEYDAVFFPGGHGPLWDLAEDKHVVALIEAFHQADKPIGAVCHGPIVFKDVKTQGGEPFVKGKKVTAFTNSEETAIGLDQIVPFSVEDELTSHGGIFSSGENWQAYVIEDGRLITGQNPASSILVAKHLLNQIKK